MGGLGDRPKIESIHSWLADANWQWVKWRNVPQRKLRFLCFQHALLRYQQQLWEQALTIFPTNPDKLLSSLIIELDHEDILNRRKPYWNCKPLNNVLIMSFSWQMEEALATREQTESTKNMLANYQGPQSYSTGGRSYANATAFNR